MIKTKFKNRDRLTLILEEIGSNQFKLTGYLNIGVRFAGEKGKITMVDPSGGPYIQLGDDLNYYFKGNNKMIINKIEVNENNITFTIDD